MNAGTLCVTCLAHNAILVELALNMRSPFYWYLQQIFLTAVLRTGHWVQWAPARMLPKVLVLTSHPDLASWFRVLALTEPTFGSFCATYVAEVTSTAW